MIWNHDITQAPRGRNVTVMRNTKTKDGIIRVPVEEFEPDVLWLASSCGKVIRSYWIPANKHHDGYWAGFAQKGGTPPVAWQDYVVPGHPFKLEEIKAYVASTVEAINHQNLEDVGSGA